jgi:hypothetical protein
VRCEGADSFAVFRFPDLHMLRSRFIGRHVLTVDRLEDKFDAFPAAAGRDLFLRGREYLLLHHGEVMRLPTADLNKSGVRKEPFGSSDVSFVWASLATCAPQAC